MKGRHGPARPVERLLAANEQVGDFLESPAMAALATPPHGGDTNWNTPAPPDGSADPEGTAASDSPLRYELGAEIGRGGMGQVVLGWDAEFEREVAVKVLLDSHQGAPRPGAAVPRRSPHRREAPTPRHRPGVRDGPAARPPPVLHDLNLGDVLGRQGKFAEALELVRRRHDLGSKRPDWSFPSAQWVKLAERRVELDKKLPAILNGEVVSKEANERLKLAQMCVLKRRSADAVRFYTDSFRADPKLAAAPSQHRSKAACSAIADAELRKQALDWLRADLAEWTQASVTAEAEVKAAIARTLGQWLDSPDLAPVRGVAVAALPGPEQAAWRELWREVESLRRQSAGK